MAAEGEGQNVGKIGLKTELVEKGKKWHLL